jgi:hypothetical protein
MKGSTKVRYYRHHAMKLASPRALGLTGAALVVAGWLLGSTLSPPVARTQQRTVARESVSGPALPPIVPLNTMATRPTPGPPSPARNPFTFGRSGVSDEVRIAAAADAPHAANASDAPVATTANHAIADEWRLLGLATAADGAMTAVVRGRGDVHLVRAGDRVAGDLLVSEVGEAGVRLQRADGTTIGLRLP